MSKSASFELIVNDNPNSIDVLVILDIFQSFGWGINDHGMICYLPLGDNDFDWDFLPLAEKDAVYSILSSKEERKELIGIILVSEKTKVGLSVLFYPMLERISLSAEINRKTIDGSNITDFTWYLEELIPVILKAGLSIEAIKCVDS